MPIGVNRVGLMGSAGGGGAGASLIQSASGGSQWNGTNPRQGGLPVRFHRFQSGGTNGFQVNDISGTGEALLYVWMWGAAGGRGGQGGNNGGSGGASYSEIMTGAGQYWIAAVGRGGGGGSGCHGCWGAGSGGNNSTSYGNGALGMYPACGGCSAGGGGGGAASILYIANTNRGSIRQVAGGGGGGGGREGCGGACLLYTSPSPRDRG